jgi:hypothetical protein
MLIFVSGHFPILGMQMLYFLDPELQRRAAIAPPGSLLMLDGKTLVRQKPIDRTSNMISRPEVVVTEDATSQLEKGFLEELQAGNVRPQKG